MKFHWVDKEPASGSPFTVCNVQLLVEEFGGELELQRWVIMGSLGLHLLSCGCFSMYFGNPITTDHTLQYLSSSINNSHPQDTNSTLTTKIPMKELLNCRS